VFSFPSRLKSWLFCPDRFAIFGLLGLLFAFYPELFLVKAAPLTGDHLEQHFPWAFQLAQSLKEFKLPFWTPLIQCGFPLVAESQVGAFYLPNLILYFFLPFRVAYSYMNLVHWFIAGWGTYLYAKQMKLGPMASFVAALIFTFGSAYGGAYYNMTSLKTICWLPLALYFLERYFDKQQWRFWVGMALLIGQSFVAGYMQMAALTWLIFGAYVLLRIFIFPESELPWTRKALTLGALTVAALLALLIALPQIYLTFQLAMFSNRTGLEEGYAYVGSMSPLVLGTLLNPGLSDLFRGNNLYAGSFSIFLMLLAVVSPDVRKSKNFGIWGAMTLLALLLALGRWSPLYVLLVKFTRFYSFRVPAKFLGFICLGLAMLSAMGFQVLWQRRSTQALIKKAFSAYLAIVAIFEASIAVANLLLTAGRDIAVKLGELFVMQFIYAKPGHPRSLAIYLEGVKNYPEQVLKYFSFSDFANIWPIAISGFCMVLLVAFLRKKTITKSLLGVGIFFLVVDLYAASYLDIKGDLSAYNSALAPSPIVNILKQEKMAGRLGRIYGFRASTERLPLVPSQNMLYGIEDIGVYSPLVVSRYYQVIGLWGNVNDSNFAVTPTPAFVTQRLPVLNFLNVSHVLSTEKLMHPDLQLIFDDPQPGYYLYANNGKHDAAHFITDIKVVGDWKILRKEFLKEGFDPGKTLLLEQSEVKKIGEPLPVVSKEPRVTLKCVIKSLGQEQWEVETDQPGFFVTSNSLFPGWCAQVNGRETPIFYADGLFQGIWIAKPGHYQIKINFSPAFTKVLRKSNFPG